MPINRKTALITAAMAVPLFTWMFFVYRPEPRTAVIPEEIAPPLRETDIPADHYSLNNDSAAVISRPTGTRIRINPRTFVREDGLPVKGPVDFQVREFHSAEDILRSGIPMTVSRDKMEILQSSGMIELRAFNEGRKLQVADGKSMQVELAGYRKADDCRLYYLQNDNTWTVPDSFTRARNSAKEERLKALVLPPADSATKEPNASGDRIFYLLTSFDHSPELISAARKAWRIDESSYRPDLMKEIRMNWDDVTITLENKRKNLYRMLFTRKFDSWDTDKQMIKSVVVLATPVENPGKADQAFFDEQSRSFALAEKRREEARALAIKKMEEEKARAEREADLLNVFAANKLGIYNIDRLHQCDPNEIIPISFDFEKELGQQLVSVTVYGIYEEENSVMRYSLGNLDKVYIPRGKNMKFMAVMPNGNLAVADQEAIGRRFLGTDNIHRISTRKYSRDQFFKKNTRDVAAIP